MKHRDGGGEERRKSERGREKGRGVILLPKFDEDQVYTTSWYMRNDETSALKQSVLVGLDVCFTPTFHQKSKMTFFL